MGARDLLKALVFTLIFFLPAVLNRGAIDFEDLGPYHAGGELIVETVAKALTQHTDSQEAAVAAGDVSMESVTSADDRVKGVRSPYYSIFAYTLSFAAPRFFMLALVQAAVLGFLFSVAAQTYRIPMVVGGGVALLTSAGSVASVAGPDIWAGILILSWALLVVPSSTLSAKVRTGLAVMVMLAVLFHASHLLLALALTVGTLGLLAVFPKSFGKAQRLGTGIAVGASSAAVFVTVLGGLLAFEEPSIAPKQYPIVLARALADGPAHDYLSEACPEAAYVVCDLYGEDIPDDVGEFLWGERGVSRIATAEQLDQLRREEGKIIAASLRQDPIQQLMETAENIFDQAMRFSLRGTKFGMYPVAEPRSGVRSVGSRNNGGLVRFFVSLSSAVVWLSLPVTALAFLASPDGQPGSARFF